MSKFREVFFKLYNKKVKNSQYDEEWLNEMCDDLEKFNAKELETTKRLLEEAVIIIKFYSIPENAGYNHELDDNVEWIDDEIYQRQGLKARQFLAKLSKEGRERSESTMGNI